MASVLSTPSYKANMSKHGHDTGQLKKFTSSVGQLLPVYYDKLYPGDKVYIENELTSRTMDLETAAMADIAEHIDYFFVPMTQIYSLFDSWIYGINDVSTSLVDIASISKEFPYMSPSAIMSFFNGLYQGQDWNYGESALRKDQFGVAFPDNVSRLWQLFGFGNHAYQFFSGFENTTEPQHPQNYGLTSLELTLPAVYQKIYMDYYRLSDREANDPTYYSLDMYYENPSVPASDLAKFFTLRYRPLKRDMFTSAQVSPIFGSQDINALENNSLLDVNQWLSEVSLGFDSQPQYEMTDIIEDSGTLTTSRINTLFAVHKLMEITRRAGKHYDAQTLAHFGQKVPDGIAGEVMYLGSHTSKIAIGDVLATATNSEDDTFLGQVGGKGYGYGQSRNIEFKAPCHGVIMGIYSAVPEVDYQPTGIDRLNTYLHPYDHWQPAFDQLGMQPLFAYQTNTKIFDPSAPSGRDNIRQRSAEELAEIIGWNYRYEELKTKIDLCLGGFSTSLDYWSTSKDGQMNNSLNNYLCDPSYLDRIMLLNYKPETLNTYLPGSCFDRDPLLHRLRVNAKKVSGMSTFGLDSL